MSYKGQGDEAPTWAEINDMKLAELKQNLRDLGLIPYGRKAELQLKLKQATGGMFGVKHQSKSSSFATIDCLCFVVLFVNCHSDHGGE